MVPIVCHLRRQSFLEVSAYDDIIPKNGFLNMRMTSMNSIGATAAGFPSARNRQQIPNPPRSSLVRNQLT